MRTPGTPLSQGVAATALAEEYIAEVKVRLITSSPNYDCSDSSAVDANYVEVIDGPGKGDKGWTAAYSDNQ